MSAHDIFWLARYAHNKTAHLFEQAKAIDPSIFYKIEMDFSRGSIDILSHWSRARPIMFQYAICLYDKAAVDKFVAKLEKDVATLQPAEADIAA